MDTLGLSVLVGAGTAERLAATLTRSTRQSPSGPERSRAYRALRLSTVTLFPTDRVGGARFCVEFSAPKVLFGENATALSALGARVAALFVLDEVESALGVSLHGEVFTVFRLDVARTLLLDPSVYLPVLARVDLPRRERTVYESGLRWASQPAQEIVYDKHLELLATAARLARSRPEVDFPDESGLPDERDALARALDATEAGALRVEVRLRGGYAIKKALRLEAATFDAVVTDANAAALLSRFLAHFSYVDAAGSAPALARTLTAGGLRGRRVLQLLGLRALTLDGLTDEQCRQLLGLRPQAYRYLKSGIDGDRARLAGDETKNALVVTDEDLARTAERDREMVVTTWLERRRVWRRSLSLSPVEPALLGLQL